MQTKLLCGFIILALLGFCGYQTYQASQVQAIFTDFNSTTLELSAQPQTYFFYYTPQTTRTESITITSNVPAVATVEWEQTVQGQIACTVTPQSAGETRITCTNGTHKAAFLVSVTETESSASPSPIVYITPSGTRWHIDPVCAGDTAIATPQSDVGSRTPCKRCAPSENVQSKK